MYRKKNLSSVLNLHCTCIYAIYKDTVTFLSFCLQSSKHVANLLQSNSAFSIFVVYKTMSSFSTIYNLIHSTTPNNIISM